MTRILNDNCLPWTIRGTFGRLEILKKYIYSNTPVIILRHETNGLLSQHVRREVNVSPISLNTLVRDPLHPACLDPRDGRSGVHYADGRDHVTAHMHNRQRIKNSQYPKLFVLQFRKVRIQNQNFINYKTYAKKE